MQTPVENEAPHSPRWTLIRDLAVLQVKLLVDGFRDLILIPASLIAAIISISRSENGKPGPEFYKLLVLGKQSEHFINLFGALRNAPADIDSHDLGSGAEMDDLVSRVESFVRFRKNLYSTPSALQQKPRGSLIGLTPVDLASREHPG